MSFVSFSTSAMEWQRTEFTPKRANSIPQRVLKGQLGNTYWLEGRNTPFAAEYNAFRVHLRNDNKKDTAAVEPFRTLFLKNGSWFRFCVRFAEENKGSDGCGLCFCFLGHPVKESVSQWLEEPQEPCLWFTEQMQRDDRARERER